MGLSELFSLKGKTAIVTGASRGIGKRMALALADAGANLVLSARNEELLRETEREAKKRGIKTLVSPIDTTKLEEIQGMVKKSIDSFGKIDILVNNAGVGWPKPVLKVTEEDWDAVIDVNAKGCFFCCQAVLSSMLEQKKGSIINISSVAASTGLSLFAPYTASKGAVSAMTRALAVEVASCNVRVNAVAPSWFETDLTFAARNNEKFNNIVINRTPFGRWGDLKELDGIVVFLASDASTYITGAVFHVDGGWTAA